METPATFDSGGAAAYNAVFVDTSLDTHFAMIVFDTDTVADLKKRIEQEHPLCFPDVGEIKLFALKVKRRGKFYHLTDSMFVKCAFHGVCNSWILSVDASTAKEHGDNTSDDVVGLLEDCPSKRLSNFEDTFLPQDGNNQLIKYNYSAAPPSDSGDSAKDVSEYLQIGIEQTADNNPKVSFPAAENDPGENDEGQGCFVNLQENESSGKISKPHRPVKKKRKREDEDAGEKSLGENRMASNFVKESPRREITCSGEGKEGKNEEHPNVLVGVQDHTSIEEGLEFDPNAKKMRKTEKNEDGENFLAENITFNSIEDGTRLEVRRSRGLDKVEDVDHEIGFINIKKNKLTEDSNMDSVRITETVGGHHDGEANMALASRSISAGAAIFEPSIASPEKGQDVEKTNHDLYLEDYDDIQAEDSDVESQTKEPGLRLLSKRLRTIPVSQHPSEQVHRPLVFQQPNDVQDDISEHIKGTDTLGNEMVVPKKSSKKIKKSMRAELPYVKEHSGDLLNDISSFEVSVPVRGNYFNCLMRKEDSPYASKHLNDLNEDGVPEQKQLEHSVVEHSGDYDAVQVNDGNVESQTKEPGLRLLFGRPETIPVDQHLGEWGHPPLVSQQHNGLQDSVSKHSHEIDKLGNEKVKPKRSSKKRKKSKKIRDQAGPESASVIGHFRGLLNDSTNDISPSKIPPSESRESGP